MEKPVLAGQRVIALLKPKEWKNIKNIDLVSAIKKRSIAFLISDFTAQVEALFEQPSAL